MWYPVDCRWRLSDSFQGHKDRTPPSRAPGIDIACPSGSEVRAPAAGTVTFSGYQSKGGRALWIQCAGFRLYVCHLSRVTRLKGEKVQAGQVIGYTGNTGQTTGPHLHLSILQAGSWVDPEQFFAATRRA